MKLTVIVPAIVVPIVVVIFIVGGVCIYKRLRRQAMQVRQGSTAQRD